MQIDHIANLAKLKLTESEIEKYNKELGEIIRYMRILGEIDTEAAAPTSQVTGLTNVLREDVACDYHAEGRSKLLALIPNFKSGFVVVPSL